MTPLYHRAFCPIAPNAPDLLVHSQQPGNGRATWRQRATMGRMATSTPLTFGVVTGQHQLSWEQLVDHWQTAESLGFDSVWLFDHFLALYGDPDGPCLETSTLLSALSLKTSRVKVGVLVYGNTHRPPALLAKEITTIDHVSGGRAILGIGAGWNEREHHAYGFSFPSPGDRVEMLDESLQIMESLFTKRRTSFHGRHYRLDDAPFSPKPLQAKLPVLIGGERPRMLRVIARHADYWDTSRPPERLQEGLQEIAEHCHEIGRAPEAIRVSSSFGADRLEDVRGFEELVRTWRAAGTSQFLFDFPIAPEGIEAAREVATRIIPRLREALG
jgi:alkanesulfonate monooxygenase SsuD/methylene tetrahydromethanopterin reductase-like flavin-dependent oxidoreductase (luciferase family)